MRIKEVQLEFRGALRIRKQTRRIIIHHTATDGDISAATVHQWHLNRGWSGIGYHYLVRTDGTVERGRPENTIGAHAGKEGNIDSIGIALAGNFMLESPKQAQIEALVQLIIDINTRHGKLPILGHRDVSATACPGDMFPMELVRIMTVEQANSVLELWKHALVEDALAKGLITEHHNPDEAADKWFVLAVALNLLKILESKRSDS